jgi:hypothetical protein
LLNVEKLLIKPLKYLSRSLSLSPSLVSLLSGVRRINYALLNGESMEGWKLYKCLCTAQNEFTVVRFNAHFHCSAPAKNFLTAIFKEEEEARFSLKGRSCLRKHFHDRTRVLIFPPSIKSAIFRSFESFTMKKWKVFKFLIGS